MLTKTTLQLCALLVLGLWTTFYSTNLAAGPVTHYRMQEIASSTDYDYSFTFSVDDLNGDGIATYDEILNFDGVYCGNCTNLPVAYVTAEVGPMMTRLAANDSDGLFGGSGTATLDLTTLKWTYTVTNATKVPGATGWSDDVDPRTVTADGFTLADARGRGHPVRSVSVFGEQLWSVTQITAAELSSNTTFTATQYLMTTSTSANVSMLHLVNQSTVAQTFTATLYNADGEQLGETNQPLSQTPVARRARLTLSSVDLEVIFNTAPWSGPAMLEVTGTGTFELMSKLQSPSGFVSNTNCVRDNSVANVEGFDSANLTYVRLINTTNETIPKLTGSLYGVAGEAIGSTNVTLATSLAPKAAVWLNRNELSDLVGTTWTGEASLYVGDRVGLKLLNLNLVNDETFFNFSCYEGS